MVVNGEADNYFVGLFCVFLLGNVQINGWWNFYHLPNVISKVVCQMQLIASYQ